MNNKERREIIAQRKPKKRMIKNDLEKLRESVTKYQNFVTSSTTASLNEPDKKEVPQELKQEFQALQNDKSKCITSLNVSNTFNENCWKQELNIISILEQITK